MVHDICFRTGSVISFPSCLMTRFLVASFLMFDVSPRPLLCIMHCSGIISVFYEWQCPRYTANMIVDSGYDVYVCFSIFGSNIPVVWFFHFFILSIFSLIIYFNFWSYPGYAIFWFCLLCGICSLTSWFSLFSNKSQSSLILKSVAVFVLIILSFFKRFYLVFNAVPIRILVQSLWQRCFPWTLFQHLKCNVKF